MAIKLPPPTESQAQQARIKQLEIDLQIEKDMVAMLKKEKDENSMMMGIITVFVLLLIVCTFIAVTK